LHFLSSEFLEDSQGKRRHALEKSQAALRNRETTISCLASASSTRLFTITYLMGVALSSDLFYVHPFVNYIRHRFAEFANKLHEYCQIQYEKWEN